MKTTLLAAVSLLVIGCASADKGIITSTERVSKIDARLSERSSWIPNLTDAGKSKSEQQALEFLYAYMPVGDVADYDIDFYKKSIAATLQARGEMPWGAIIPETEFLHFVLPIRVNNENMDTSRMVFYAELKNRVKDLSMYDAILEVNNWCHEKASYTPSDSRTISPLGIVRNATGRCGEQSTFTVAALRAVGIPSRQIYVPRWAHTDDNHAWVEAWAADKDGKNGKWYYLGACEPEPVLNTGWFDAPAARSMMMFTKAFGHYAGDEEVLTETECYTELNVTSAYAPTSKGTVQVVDSLGAPVADANVLFTIYNYASYYPVIRVKTDAQGLASIRAGKGDMAVWASKEGKVAAGELDFRSDTTVRLTLTSNSMVKEPTKWDLNPPQAADIAPKVTPQQREANNVRFAAQDALREQYISTFCNQKQAFDIATEIGADSARVWNVLKTSRGNHDQIKLFLLNTPREDIAIALELLEVISTKDLCDTPADVLIDHLRGAVHYSDKAHFRDYILNPRIDNELLTPYRATLSAIGGCSTADAIIKLSMDISIADSLNPASIPITVMGTNKLKIADATAAERYTIALLRSKGFAARREPLTERLQYFDNDKWINIDQDSTATVKGNLEVTYNNLAINANPKLDIHFTIARFDGKEYRTLDLNNIAPNVDMGAGANFSDIFSKPLPIEVGKYLLITGTRLAQGTVLTRNTPFEIKAGEDTKVDMVMRTTETDLQVIGNINPEELFIPKGDTSTTSLLSQTGRGYFTVALLDAKKEPSTHMLRDLNKAKSAIEAWGRPIVLIFRDKEQMEAFKASDFPELPKNVIFGADAGGKMSSMMGKMLEIKDVSRLPIVVVGDSFGRVFYISTGYNISLGEQLSLIIENLK